MSEHGTVERVVKELRVLQNWQTTQELADEVGSTYPTVSKDIEELDKMGLIVRRFGERKGDTKGKKPIKYRLKTNEDDLMKRKVNSLIEFMEVLQTFDEHRRQGLTSKQLVEEIDVPLSKCMKFITFLKSIKWIEKKGFGPIRNRPYVPKFRIIMLGDR